MDTKKLFLLDAYALIYRAYYALIHAPRITSKGINTSAIFGFCNTLDEILRKENPTHIAVCFDPSGKTFRHEAYPEYKAQRQAQPEDITLSVPYIKRIIKAFNIPIVEADGFEADDVIGTLARRAEAEGFTTYMMTPDKDYGQLVTDRILMYRPSLRGQGFEIRGPKEVCEKYGIKSPRQVIDLLALEGDTSDNIPGCPGVGEKTAIKLIGQWDSVENLLDNTASLTGALKKKVEENAEKIRFSKFLATIKTDVPVNISLDSLKRSEPDTEALRDIYTELEFKTFISRLGSVPEKKEPAPASPGLMGSLFDMPEAEAAPRATAVSIEKGTTVTDISEIKSIIGSLCKCKTVAISTYAVGQEAMTAILYGISFAADGISPVYIPVPPMEPERKEWAEAVRPLFSADGLTIASHDVKRDMIILGRENIEFATSFYDTSVAHYLLQPEMRHSLQQVSLAYLDIPGMMTDDSTVKPFAKLPAGSECEVNCNAAQTVLKLIEPLDADLRRQGLEPLMRDIELPMIEVLASMEQAGARIDADELARLSQTFSARLADLEEEAYTLAGQRFNISSPMQVGEILFDKLKIDPKAKKTKRGAYSTTEEILEKLRDVHPIVGIILKVRGLKKLLATYINALPGMVNPLTGKIHTTYNQTITATGRLSSTNPNLQNIPIRTDDGRGIRRAFIADDGNLLLSADYSQIELRLLADLSGDPDMIEAFRSGMDFHAATAAKIYNVTIDEVTDAMRRNAKTANFGIVYGISAFGLSERLDIPRSEAKQLIDGYYNTYPGVKKYMDEAVEKARSQGYVTTVMGRKRFLPDINSRNAVVRGYAERNAVNAPLQGSAADIIKRAMIDIYRELRSRNMRSKMIMQVHDELIFNVVPEELPALQELVVNLMRGAMTGPVPLEVSAGVGKNWLEAH